MAGETLEPRPDNDASASSLLEDCAVDGAGEGTGERAQTQLQIDFALAIAVGGWEGFSYFKRRHQKSMGRISIINLLEISTF